MSGDGVPSKTERPLTRGQKVLLACAFLALLVWIFSLRTPIPSGKENRAKASAFLKQQFPDREVSPRDSVTAPVALVYDLIRSGEPEVARRAIEFAADQRFGYAAPYVIERLGSGDAELERAAQAFLREIAGGDYGPGAESWRAWWRAAAGLSTFAVAVPAALALGGVSLMAVGGGARRAALVRLGVPLVGVSWFMACCLTMLRLVGSPETCTFGASRITYYAEHGAVVGLEDARVGGAGLLILLVAVFMVLGFAVVTCARLIDRRSRAAGIPTDHASAR